MTGRTIPKPRRAAVPLAASAAILAVWGAVARGSGVGWVQTVGALVAGLLIVGLAGPALAVWRVRVTAVAAPADAVAGSPATVEVTVRGGALVLPLWPPGPEVPSGRGTRVRLELTPPYRGVLEHCVVSLSSAAPFGLMWWARTVAVALPHPVAVAPRCGAPDLGTIERRGEASQAGRTPGAGSELRGVRPYVPGDRPALVHWPATAHTGSLMVREHERPSWGSALVRGVLPPAPDAADAQAERVLATVAMLLSSGIPVQLATAEAHGEVVADVRTRAAAGRRLASALPRRGYGPDAGDPVAGDPVAGQLVGRDQGPGDGPTGAGGGSRGGPRPR